MINSLFISGFPSSSNYILAFENISFVFLSVLQCIPRGFYSYAVPTLPVDVG